MPHGQCYLWNPGLVGLHLATDLAIGLSCVAISLTLALFVRRANRDVPFSWVFLGFGVFIIASGMTHFMEVWTLWTPLYWLSGAVKLTTAAASITVAIVLPPLVPKSLALLRSAKLSEQRRLDLESTVQSLREEVAERARAESEIRKLNADLEMGVRLRTDELAHANQSLARLAAIVECSNDAIVSVDIDNRITSWNSAAERLYGYVKDEILGRPVSILAPADLSSETPDLIGSLRRGERVNSIETVRVRKTGEAASVQITASLIKNGAGETEGASLIVRDVTDRKRAEGMFRVAVEAAPNAVVIVDEHGKIKLVNAQTEKLFGYSREE